MASKLSWGSLGTVVRMELAAAGFASDAKSWDRLPAGTQTQLYNKWNKPGTPKRNTKTNPVNRKTTK
tara:strand:- start:3777 stop:3977 length:201 start_codon:yes stop_codon:yes gene_type:complete